MGLGALREGQGIQRRFIWCASLSGLLRSSNYTNEIDQKDQMNQIPATRREMVSGTLLFLLATYAGVIMLTRASVDRSFEWA